MAVCKMNRFLSMGIVFCMMLAMISCTGGSGSEYTEKLLVDLSSIPGEAVYKDNRLQRKINMVTRDPKIFRDPRETPETALLRVTFEMDSQKMWFHMKKAYYLGSSDNKPCILSLPLPGSDIPSTLTFTLAGLKNAGEELEGKLDVHVVDGNARKQLEATCEEETPIPVKRWNKYTVQLPAHSDNSYLEFSFKSPSRYIEHCFLGLPRIFSRQSHDASRPSVVFICVDACGQMRCNVWCRNMI